MHTIFGEKLRAERKKMGLSALELAESCKTSRSYITLIENGKRLPGKLVLPRIASALKLKPVTVLNWYLEDVSANLQKHMKTSK